MAQAYYCLGRAEQISLNNEELVFSSERGKKSF